MRHSAMRLLMFATCAVAATTVVASETEASSQHVRKHHHQRMSHHDRTSLGFNDPGTTGAIAPVSAPSFRRTVCPGMGRSFDCAVWPPPYDEDPDRKVSGSDGG